MSKHYFAFLIILIAFTGCKKDNSISLTDYNKSYNAWLKYKNNAGNSYTYTNSWGSWAGFGAELKTNVQNGVVISRDYFSYRYDQVTKSNTTLKQWHEDAAHINTHPDDVADALTLDAVYAKAKNYWLKADTKTNDVYFEAKNSGLISSAGFVPKGCQDDCFNGITITSITTL